MRLIKDVDDSMKAEALSVLNALKVGKRVFGNVAEGLKITLRNKEKQLQNLEDNKSKLEVLSVGDDIKSDIKLLKAGIKGEEDLAEYLEQIIKYDPSLRDIVFFASLSDPEQNNGGDDYISDSDFIAVYGNNILIMDAKNIRTNPEVPIYLQGDTLVSASGQELMELHASTHIWRNIFEKYGLDMTEIGVRGCVVIVNSTGALVWKNETWFRSNVKPMHMSDLVQFLQDWIRGKDNTTSLQLLTTIANMQIKKEKSNLDLTRTMKKFGI